MSFLAPSHGYQSQQQTEVQGELLVGSPQCTVQNPFLCNSQAMQPPQATHGSKHWRALSMEAEGNFCLNDAFFPGCPGDSLIFRNNDLAQLMRQGYHIPTCREKATGSTSSTKAHQSPHAKESMQKHLLQRSRKTNMTTRTATPPPSPGSRPVRKTINEALTRIAAAPPVKGAANMALLHILPPLRADRSRPTLTALSTEQVEVCIPGTGAPPEVLVI